MSGQKSHGFTIFFTGLSSSGKSTTSELVDARLQEILNRLVTVLDGDEVRQHLSAELGFTKEGRDANVRRIGYVASLITKHGGIAICSSIAPYREARREVREMVEQYGSFIEVYMATSLEECERRDVKGLYAKARAGEVERFTGVSDPYEQPEQPELRINTEGLAPEQSCELVIEALGKLGHL
jgi:sulfate adenylyltransferase